MFVEQIVAKLPGKHRVAYAGQGVFNNGVVRFYFGNVFKFPDVETTYTERRAPRKKKLVRISRIMNFQNPKYYQQLIKAFEDERDNTVSASKTDKMMTYRFENNKGRLAFGLRMLAFGLRMPAFALWQPVRGLCRLACGSY